MYVAIAVARESVPGRDEIFPFASWSLFSMVPNESRDFTVRILQVDGRPIDRPMNFEEAHALFGSAAVSHGARMSIQRLGEAVERRDAASVDRVRGYFEGLHLRGHEPVRYELLARRYDPLERWRRGTFRSVRVIATFQTGNAPPVTPQAAAEPQP